MADSQATPAASTAAPAASAPAAPAPVVPTGGQPAPVNNPPTATSSTQPIRSFLPGAPLSSAEKSLFPSAMPGNRSLPGLPNFGSPAAASASPSGGATPSNAAAAGAAGSPVPLPAGSPPYSVGLSAPAPRIGQTGRSPSATSPYAPHAPSKSPSIPPSAYPGHGATPTPPIIPPPATGRSPATSPNPPRSTAIPAQSQQSPPPPASSSQAGSAGAPSRGNPMSVSSMLSGPCRDRPVAAYSPTAAPTSGAATPGTLAAPVVSATPTGTTPQSGGSAPPAPKPKTAGTPQPPVMPQSQQAASKPSTSAPASASTATSASTPNAATPGGPERSSYPPLPSAYARESPYAPAPGGAPTPTSRPGGQQQSTSGGGASYQHSTWSSASAALAHAQAQQQQAKDSLFPAAGGSAGQTPSPGGVARPPSTSGPGPYGPSAAARTASGLQNGASTAPTLAPIGANGTNAGASFAWQAEAAQQAQQVQRERERETDASKSASAAAMQARPGQIGQPNQQQPQPQPQPQPSTASYGALRGAAAGTTPPGPLSNGTSAATAASSHKRRRSELPAATAAPVVSAQAVETPPAPPPAAPAPPLFTYVDQRRACIRPPMIEVVNEAVDAWERQHRQDGEKSAERPFCGRVVYDALVPPAKLLDGDVLANGVGGYVEVLVPTTWILGPASSRSSADSHTEQVRSSCSVPSRNLPSVAFSVGSPASYAGTPLPQTSPSTPLALPAHLADLPGFRKRQVWGTDVYTDDSDILALLVHSGWLRVTRRERKRRAGEKGAGADAIRRARIEGEERIETVAASGVDGEASTTADVQAIKVTLGVVPPLVRYQGIERQGVRSRSWGNGHDGVSLRVEHVELLQELPAIRPPRLRKSVAAKVAEQLAAWEERLLVAESNDVDQFKPLKRREPLLSMRPPKRYRLDPSSPGDGTVAATAEPIVVSDTFVLPLGEGTGRFVDAEDAVASADEDGLEPSDAMDVE